MCQPASFVLTKDRVFWSRKSDSHTDVISEFSLHEDGAYGPNLVKIEISPPGGDMRLPLSGWVYRLDQDRLPDWYEAEDAEERGRKALVEWAADKLVLDGHRTVNDGQQVFAYNSASVTACGSASVTACDSASVRAYNSASVRAYNSASVTACENHSTARCYDRVIPPTPKGKFAVVIDCRGNKAVCTVGES